MSIEKQAMELERIAKEAYTDPGKALREMAIGHPNFPFLHAAVIEHIALLMKPARKPRSRSLKDAR